MIATRIVLVRHAEPDASVRDRCYGRTDCGLSPHGVEQTAALAETLAHLEPAAIYSSSLRRALDTSRPIAARLSLDPVVVDDLAEIDVGELEGLTWDEVEARHPGFFFWTTVPAGFHFPGGESYAELSERAHRALDAIIERHPGETVLVVAHAGVLRTQLARALGMDPTELFRLSVAAASISVVDWLDGNSVVRLLNADRLPSYL